MVAKKKPAAAKKTARKRKYVVWLSNHTDRRDDEWRVVFAKDEAEARDLVVYPSYRFSIDRIWAIKEFRKFYGRNFPV